MTRLRDLHAGSRPIAQVSVVVATAAGGAGCTVLVAFWAGLVASPAVLAALLSFAATGAGLMALASAALSVFRRKSSRFVTLAALGSGLGLLGASGQLTPVYFAGLTRKASDPVFLRQLRDWSESKWFSENQKGFRSPLFVTEWQWIVSAESSDAIVRPARANHPSEGTIVYITRFGFCFDGEPPRTQLSARIAPYAVLFLSGE